MSVRATRPPTMVANPAARRVVRRLLGGVTTASVLLGAGGPAQADPAEEAARITAQHTALAAAARDVRGVSIAPEVSATRTLLAPPGSPAVAPDGRPMTELAGVHLRLALSHGRTTLGVGVGTLGYVQPGPGLHGDGPLTLAGATPSLSVGMRYRMSRESAVFADASGARALPPDMSGYLSTKVGMEWKPASSRLGFDHGALGVHFDSGYRLSLKARKDGLRIYLRGQF